jgi:hypothetical protein
MAPDGDEKSSATEKSFRANDHSIKRLSKNDLSFKLLIAAFIQMTPAKNTFGQMIFGSNDRLSNFFRSEEICFKIIKTIEYHTSTDLPPTFQLLDQIAKK